MQVLVGLVRHIFHQSFDLRIKFFDFWLWIVELIDLLWVFSKLRNLLLVHLHHLLLKFGQKGFLDDNGLSSVALFILKLRSLDLALNLLSLRALGNGWVFLELLMDGFNKHCQIWALIPALHDWSFVRIGVFLHVLVSDSRHARDDGCSVRESLKQANLHIEGHARTDREVESYAPVSWHSTLLVEDSVWVCLS